MKSPPLLVLLLLLLFFPALPGGEVSLVWNDNANNEDGYKIERAIPPAGFIQIATTGGNTTSFIDPTAPAGLNHYRVRAYNEVGNSAYSNIAVANVPAVEILPNDPDGLLTKQQGALANISARAQVVSGENILIGGFSVLHGDATLLIRGVGPELANYGITGFLADPRLQIIGGPANDDWVGTEVISAAAHPKVNAFPLTQGSKDAALVVALPPGVYTVHLTSGDGTSGVALLEIYLVPGIVTATIE